ncbi:MAG: HEAT repeat domain-containing protein [Candidatus Nanopelagicales bacterium]
MTVQEKRRDVTEALGASRSSVRVAAALRAGSNPAPHQVGPLIARCAVEPDFYVRDMLTWALIRHDRDTVVDLLLPQLASEQAQARSQALHTLSKIGGPRVWAAMSQDLVQDDEDEVARAAWLTAVRVVPPGQEVRLAGMLATQFGRGSREVRISLSRAMLELGEAAAPEVRRAMSSADDDVRTHALATARMIEDPNTAFDAAVEEAKRVHTLRGAPLVGNQLADR